MAPLSRHRTLLLTLDAFNTIFHPRRPIPAIYAGVAQDLGVIPSDISHDVVKTAFKAAFKHNSAHYPNYGRDTPGFGGPKVWWGNVIRECFANVKGRDSTVNDIPDRLVETLIGVFEGDSGYKLYDDVIPFFKKLQAWKDAKRSGNTGKDWDRIVIGVVSNADDRVPTILRSLGLHVGSAWANSGELLPTVDKAYGAMEGENDIDFIVTSYEAGKEKPHKHIFDVARKRAEEHLRTCGADIDCPFPAGNDLCVHVGDDYHDDYEGARNAGARAGAENSPLDSRPR
ncbi:predicted protein [Uncinocarpus reesii 1704]|uniref:Haloacid dehalogenase n=1 Tax=Uncinocarpus reesii (strain UAMH 1704) TaxID=336963 RepID=C4JWX5_UNCRE|nr:uncharacterized protein UREG_06148 [Uncinocarpus reesii 1704]EEP81283.1 predicted protein [Uncinocarpus reesii 1704]